jgi:hypothetical protein
MVPQRNIFTTSPSSATVRSGFVRERIDRGVEMRRKIRSAQHLCALILGLWGGAAAAEGFTGQGIYPGDAAADAFKLPFDFEPYIRLRTSHKLTETLTETTPRAWAIGGFAGLRSPWFGDLVQLGVVGYTS